MLAVACEWKDDAAVTNVLASGCRHDTSAVSGLARSDDLSVILQDRSDVVLVEHVCDIFAGRVAPLNGDHLGADEANAITRLGARLRDHIDHHDPGQQLWNLGRLDVLAPRKLPGRRLVGQIVRKAAKPWVLIDMRTVHVIVLAKISG